MGKKSKKKAPSGPKGAPEWIVTFTDMISLLVTFFVLLMTFSSLESRDMIKVNAWLFGKRGVMDSRGEELAAGPESDLVSEANILRGARQPHARPADELEDNLAEMGQKKSAADLELAFDSMPDGLVLEFGDEEAFAPGADRVDSALARALGEIGRVLEHYQHLIVVEGFADGAFKASPAHRSPEELAFSRAASAADALLASSRIAPERVQVASLGNTQPRASNDTAEHRIKNRRVQIRVLSLSRSRASQLGIKVR